MSIFMPHNEHNLRSAHLGDRVVPHDNTLRRADARYVGVEFGGFLFRAHPEHALRRNLYPGALHQFFQARRQHWILLLQRLELVEHGIDNLRLQEDEEQANRQ